MLWFWLAILAYFFFAVNQLGDRYLLRKIFPDILVYAFYAGLLSGVVLVAVPFLGFPVGGLIFTLSALFCGAVFVVALIANYLALQRYEASRIVPAIGGLLPLFTLLLAYLAFPEEELVTGQVISLVFFIAGSVIITARGFTHLLSRSFGYALIAASLFGVYFVSLRFTYEIWPSSFWAGFLWTRLGSVLAALAIFILAPSVRRIILARKRNEGAKSRREKIRSGLFFLGNKSLGAIATIIQNKSISIAPPLAVSLVNALQGVQYVFLIVIAYFVSIEMPSLLEESFSGKALAQKITAILFFAIGTLFLIYYK
ncbi:MAG: hypothetical protein V1856_00170 [Candidatus Liptonbacteria bacterium]